jgi:hypothetical protein
MLITNFAAGELAKTLFGRTDLGQYYGGVSLLENFDVIPTGGISRRNGTRRLRTMPGADGRLIPFIVDRRQSFLLWLSDAAIRLFGTGGNEVPVTLADPLPSYAAADVHEVQYAQDNGALILVHKKYPPVVFERTGESAFRGSLFRAAFGIEIVAEPSVDRGPYIRNDPLANTGFLTLPNGYPGSVMFVNGRLVFAGTESAPQRLFVSKVDNPRDFSTRKLFLTEKREYASVSGKVDEADARRLVLDEGQTLNGNLHHFILDTDLYPPGTTVTQRMGNVLIMSRPAGVMTWLPGEEAALAAKADEYNRLNAATPTDPGDLTSEALPYYGVSEQPAKRGFMLSVGVSVITVKTRLLEISASDLFSGNVNVTEVYSYFLDSNAAAFLETDPGYIRNFIMGIVNKWSYTTLYSHVLDASIALLESRVRAYMRWDLIRNGAVLRTWWNSPDVILGEARAEIDLASYVYVPMYTREIIADEQVTADCGFTFEIASDMSDEIKWLAQNKHLIAGTETGEWLIPSGVTAVNIVATLNSRYGSDRIQATAIGDALCFFQTGKKALIEYYIPQQDANFRANNMAMLSKDMLHESPAFDFDFISAPYTKIFVSREDGTLVCLLYERTTGTFAWSRITTGGTIRSVAAVPGDEGYDDVYLIVERSGVPFLERLSDRIRERPDSDAEVFLDSYKRWNNGPKGYTAEAVVYDETDDRIYDQSQPPIPGHTMWIGYPYTSRVRSMPVLANDRMRQNNIKTLDIRFSDSFMPKVRSLFMEGGQEREGPTDSIGRPEPYSGVVRIPFPGSWARDVFFEFVHDRPTRCRVLAVNAEVN